MQYAIKSILLQSHSDFEIVISDNASDEDYGSYVQSLSDRRIIYLRQPSPVPVSENWARALHAATGDYILMLGDDDALVPRFSEIVLPQLSSSSPDILYVAAYHYCYPGVQPASPSGYFARVRSEFFRGDPGPFCLTASYAKELAGSVLEFRHRFNYNAQHFVLKRSFLSHLLQSGGIYQSPYPDFFSAVLTFFRARSIVAVPEPAVVIGISPKSFGAYYFSLRQEDGYKFLGNEEVDASVIDFVEQVMWPGDMNNTKWLISAEMARRALAPSSLPQANVERYHAIQLVSLLRDRYWYEKPLDREIAELRRQLSTVPLTAFDFLCSALELTAKRDRNLLIPLLQAVERQIGQYADDYYTIIDIGPHNSIEDALAWLRDSFSGGAERSNPATNAAPASRSTSPVRAEGHPLHPEENRALPIAARLRRLGGNAIRAVFPAQAASIIWSLKGGPIRTLGTAIARLRERTIGERKFPAGDGHGLTILVKRGGERCVITPGLFDDFDFRDGDQLTVLPAARSDHLLRTPEGDFHIRGSDGKGIRIPQKMEFKSMMGYRLPEHLVRLTGAGSETFEELGRAHIRNYRKYVGLEAGMSFLEIGSGIGRDALQLISVLGPNGHYIGIDVQRESIVWCQKNITRKHPNFEFVHFDAHHELHNPYGAKKTMDFTLPTVDRSVDRVGLQSVLTHIFEEEVVHYLNEIARVLKPTGLAYVTFLLYSEQIVEASRRNNLTQYGLRFEHRFAEGCYVDNSEYPTGGVAYTDDAMQRMIRRAGLRLVRPYLKGQWSGYHQDPDDDGQDVAILTPNTV